MAVSRHGFQGEKVVEGSTLVPCAVLWRGLHLCPVLHCGGVYTYALCCGGVYTYALYYTMNCGGVYTLNLCLESDWIQVYSVGSTSRWKFLWQFSMLSMEWSQVIPLWHSFWEIYLKRVCFLDFERFIYLFKDCFVSSRLCDCKDSSWLSDVPELLVLWLDWTLDIGDLQLGDFGGLRTRICHIICLMWTRQNKWKDNRCITIIFTNKK